MSRADRLERLDKRRIELEAEYHDALVAALQETASGTWGLFGHAEDAGSPKTRLPSVIDLCDRGLEINDMRERLGLGDFALHDEFEASRGKVSAQAPGEPRQAKAWLERLGKTL